MSELRFAMIGAGFWANFQLAAWHEVAAAKCVAICDRSRDKAEALAAKFGVEAVYCSPSEMLSRQSLDFVDVVSNVESHAEHVELAVRHKLPVICQKPMAPSLEAAREMAGGAKAAGIDLLIHENWRWQAPIRRLKQILASGRLGKVVRGRIDYANSFPVFDNQPFLKELKQFILTDIGTHILDVARMLFGEATQLVCQTRQMRDDISGEDVATVLMRMESGVSVTCNMSYASRWELDRFPQTMIAIEGTQAGVSLGVDYEIKIVDSAGVQSERIPIPKYAWAEPAYGLIHASIVDCQRNLLDHLCGVNVAETTSDDNLRTLQLVFAAYESHKNSAVVKIDPHD